MCTRQNIQNTEQTILNDTSQIQNDTLTTWIVTYSGWGVPDLEEGKKRMNAYQTVADKWEINIELSGRLGTLQSYKYAPSVVKEIMDHNDKIFLSYEKKFGKDWQQRFSVEVNEKLKAK